MFTNGIIVLQKTESFKILEVVNMQTNEYCFCVDRLNKLRKSKGYTIESLAKKANISNSVLSKICAGVSVNPSNTTTLKLAETLGTSVEYLYGKINEDDLTEFSNLSSKQLQKIKSVFIYDDKGEQRIYTLMACNDSALNLVFDIANCCKDKLIDESTYKKAINIINVLLSE